MSKSHGLIITECANKISWGEKVPRLLTSFPMSTTSVSGFLGFPDLIQHNISVRWHWHLADCFFNLLHWLKTTDSQNWHLIQFSGLLEEEKNTWEKGSSLQRALSQSQQISFLLCILPPLFFILLNQSELFNWERHGGQTQTFSVPGPASSSAAVRAPLCWACWAESVSGTKRCERWQTAAGPESNREENEMSDYTRTF